MEDDVLAGAEAELQNVLFEELHVSTGLDLSPIHKGSVGTPEINYVWPNATTLAPVRTLVGHEAELDHRVLFGAGRMINCNVSDFPLPPWNSVKIKIFS